MMAGAWGSSFGLAWGDSWGLLTTFPQYVDARWPDWKYTEQMARATGGHMLAHIASRRNARRGW